MFSLLVLIVLTVYVFHYNYYVMLNYYGDGIINHLKYSGCYINNMWFNINFEACKYIVYLCGS